LKTKAGAKIRNLCLLNITIHVSHEDDLVAIQLPGGDSNTKVMKEGSPRWARVTLLA